METPDLQQRFLEIIALEEPERQTRLEEIGRDDPRIKKELESLLHGHEGNRRDDLSSHGISTAHDFHERLRAQELIAGDTIGSYEIVEKLGEGGFSIVYLARQSEPVNRRLAIKLIKPGMDTQSVLARFSAEQQALALLNHPGITRVHDFGMTDDGRPWFAMEYVDGVPITRYCNREKATIDQRLDLFVDLCAAVHHAHLRGILHRDLKPSNVLIATDLVTGSPVIKVIDFGIAKAMNMELSKGMLATRIGQLIGTPEYMSPEQAVIAPLDIDVRSDVFSLGVVLYEMLSGLLPVSAESFHGIDITEMQRLIRENPPARPAVRFDHQDQSLQDELSACRGVSTSELRALLESEISWIPMKALSKKPEDRYDSVQALSDDITRHSTGLPLLAGPEKWSYRCIKFVSRNRLGVATALCISLFLAFVSVFSTFMWVREQAALAESERNLAIARATKDAMKSLATTLEPDYVFEQLRDHFSPEFMDPLLRSGEPLSNKKLVSANTAASAYLTETIYQPLIVEIGNLMDDGQFESAIELASDYSRVAWQAGVIPASDALLDILEEASIRGGTMDVQMRLGLINRRASNALKRGDLQGAHDLQVTGLEMLYASPDQSRLQTKLWYLMNNHALVLRSMGERERAHSMAIDLKALAVEIDDFGLLEWSSFTLSTTLHNRGLWQEAYEESLSGNKSWHAAIHDGTLGSLDDHAFEFISNFAESARMSGYLQEALTAYEALCKVATETYRGALDPTLSEKNTCRIAEEIRVELGLGMDDSP